MGGEEERRENREGVKFESWLQKVTGTLFLTINISLLSFLTVRPDVMQGGPIFSPPQKAGAHALQRNQKIIRLNPPTHTHRSPTPTPKEKRLVQNWFEFEWKSFDGAVLIANLHQKVGSR